MMIYPYLVALHTSIAMMEIFGWILAAAGFYIALVQRRKLLLAFMRKYRAPICALILFWLWVTVSLLASPLEKPFVAQWGFMRWTVLLFGMTQGLIWLWSPRVERRLVWLWGAMIVVTGTYAGLQFLTGWDFIRPGRGLVNPQGGGVYKAVGFFSMSLTFAYVFGLSLFTVVRRGARQWGPLATVFVVSAGILGLVASMSRGAWLASFLAVILYLFFEKRKWLLPVLLAVAVALAGATLLHDGLGDKIRNMTTLTMDHSSSVRVNLWRAHWSLFLDHPLFGVGIFESDKLLPEYYARLGIDQTFVSHAHSNYLQWLAGTGLPGFALYMYLIWFFLKGSWEMRKRDAWGWGLFLAQIFVHIGGLTEANFIDGEVNHFVVFIWALTWARMDHFTVVSPLDIKKRTA